VIAKNAYPPADGTWDCLSLSLDQVADWRDASSGSSSRWRCADIAELTFVLAVTDPHGDTWTDCRTWGADPTLSTQSDSITDCAVVEEFEVTTTDTGDTGDTGGPTYSAGDVAACDG